MSNAEKLDVVDRPRGMRHFELEVLGELIIKYNAQDILEIGMAEASSSVKICAVLKNDIKKGRLTSIDPYQSSECQNRGLKAVAECGCSDIHSLIEEPDYIALPKLVSQGKKYDLIFIDGWHSFENTFIDIFFCDLLLKAGGIMAFHDTEHPSVFKACRYLETNMPYVNIGPAMAVNAPIIIRMIRRIFRLFKGGRALRDARLRRMKWHTIAAYRKMKEHKGSEYDYHKF